MKDYVEVIGYIWMPRVMAAQTYTMDSYAIENASDENGTITRDSVEDWLNTHAGDFSEIVDFSAFINGVEIPWQNEESEFTYNDCMFGDEE